MTTALTRSRLFSNAAVKPALTAPSRTVKTVSLADISTSAPLRRKGGAPCPVSAFFTWSAEHEPDNEANFAKLVADGASHTGLSKLIRDHTDYDRPVPAAGIGKHLRGDCRCGIE